MGNAINDDDAARYEFRIFSDTVDRQERILSDTAACVDRENRTDIYFLGRDISPSFKLRNGTSLDLKAMRGKVQGYELWVPCGMVDLPANRTEILQAFEETGSLPPIPQNLMLDKTDIITAFRAFDHIAISVTKRRTRFSVDDVLAEVTHVGTQVSPPVWTIAIEGPDRQKLENCRQRLHLGDAENVSYPAWLSRVAAPD